ncbi:MAG: deoxyuridine 5'-triphosphate nucleotidohydrolase [Candidatus Omnitrophota bacterium]|nr:deoxyuridine 5'-triphosphate nucleotidohydrolase [Candidatus Omnitrophota bacterium]
MKPGKNWLVKMLNRQEIEKLIREKSLVSKYIDLTIQLTPNGIDLTVEKIFEFKDCGTLDFSNKQRKLSECSELIPGKESPEDKFGWWLLKKGIYKIKTNEVVNLPLDLVGIAFPRSSLLRLGAFTQTGIWDAGFRGESEFVLVVENLSGIKIKQNSRIIQLAFLRMNETIEGYNGIYQR